VPFRHPYYTAAGAELDRAGGPGLSRETAASPAAAGPKSVRPRGPSRSWDLQSSAPVCRRADGDLGAALPAGAGALFSRRVAVG